MRDNPPDTGSGELVIALTMLGGTLLLLAAGAAWETATWVETGSWRPGRYTPTHGLLLGVVLLLLCVVLWRVGRWNKHRVDKAASVDRKAEFLGEPDPHGYDAVMAKARDDELLWADDAAPGICYGQSIRNGRDGHPVDLYLGWEDTMWVEIGQRGGKTTNFVIPAVLDAPGNVVTTSMRRDLPDAVRWACEQRGNVYIFDGMDITGYYTGALPPWWWNPLRDIGSGTDASPVRANALAKIFVEAVRPVGATQHGFFDQKGPQLLGCLILAAACIDAQLPQIFRWLNNPDDEDSLDILKRFHHDLAAHALRGIYRNRSAETTGDVFSTAANAFAFLVDPRLMEWVTDDGSRPEFIPADFVKPYRFDARTRTKRIARNTLILLSRKGDGTAGPLTGALLAAVTRAAEEEAAQWPMGRMPVPFVMPLDEIPNTAPIPTLPDDLTHRGGSGIVTMAMFQSFKQAMSAWGPERAGQLWDVCTRRVFGVGHADDVRLASISKLLDQRWVTVGSTTSGGMGGTSTSVTAQREDILSVGELGALSNGRFVLIPAGGYPVMGRGVQVKDRPDLAWKVNKSKALYQPKGQAA